MNLTGTKASALQLILVLASLLFAPMGCAAILTVTVIRENDVITMQPCNNALPKSCMGTLHMVNDMLKTPEWQAKLIGKYDAVRLRFVKGIYRLTEPLTITWGTGRTSGIRLELEGQGAWGSEIKTIFSGARSVGKSFGLLGGERPILGFDISDFPSFSAPPGRGAGEPVLPVMTELFQGDTLLPIAAWPNRGYGAIDRPPAIPASDRITFGVHGRNAIDWIDEPNLLVSAFWFYDWSDGTYPATVQANSQLTLAGKGSFYGIKTGQRLRVENARSELDVPGEWYLDRGKKQLLVWPLNAESAEDGEGYELSVAKNILIIEKSRGVLVKNIGFEKMRGDAVLVKDSEDVVLDKASIRHTGNRALVITGGRNCGVRNALMESNGEGAVILSGGDRRTLVPSRHFVEKSEIKNFSRLSKTYRHAVEILGVGNRVEGNVISKSPHAAIQFEGNDHLINNNEIFSVVEEASDAGAIYTGRDFTAQGTIIENNFLHDIRPGMAGQEVKGIYLDDQASGIVVRNNIFVRVQQPVFIGGGRSNRVENNLFYDSSPAIHLDARGTNWQRQATLDPLSTLQIRLNSVPFNRVPYSLRYPHLAAIMEDEIGVPKYNLFKSNTIVKGKAFDIERGFEKGLAVANNIMAGEDVFASPLLPSGRVGRSDFRLKSGR